MVKTFKEFINETLWGNSMKRAEGEEVRKEDEVEILYHPEKQRELEKIIADEVEKQGGINLDLRMIDVSKIKNMKYLFSYYSTIKSLDISNWDVSNVENMKFMFFGCSSLQSLDVSNWNISNVTNMDNMFKDCPIKYKKQGNSLVRI